MLLVKNAEVYAPEYLGKKDVLVCGGKIERIQDQIGELPVECEVLDGEGKILTPGFLDQHVHITGGGGEGSFHTRTPELQLSELVEYGITTVVGLLGTDGITRSVDNLYAKTRALCEEGVSAYMLTGAYGYPGPTITGEPDRDIVFIKEILGVKLAISDHRAPNVTEAELIQIASKARVAGMLSGKPGIVVLHMGDDPAGLTPVFQALETSSVPIRIFRPTHVNRNERLMEEGYELLRRGGYVDLTCGMHISPGKCVLEARKRGIPTEHMTMSSDGHGSWSNYAEDGTLLEIGVSSVDALYKELNYMVKELGMPLEEALPYLTSQVAESLDLLPKKGVIREGADGDFLLFDRKLSLDTYVAGGRIFRKDGRVLKKGTYEA
ncbi:beta-aspartyl-peptidase [Candidatus Merdisoma sp. HCP28S3_D10]|uniref:beta-aspartyl-peptidase n=1 Tax=unclassified Candidatus Merdisoma TaxID=3099611 RepID=UPI003F8B4573